MRILFKGSSNNLNWPVCAALIFLLCSAAASQTGAGWSKQSPATSPPPRFAHAMAYDAAHGQVVLFGGENAANVLFGDTWVWDGSTWTQKSPQTSPPAREGHAMVYDSARGQVILFGGQAGSGPLGPIYLRDTWVWDGSNWTQKSPQASPSGRFGASMAFDSARAQAVLFSGSNAFLLSDTWIWDGANWSQKTPQTSPPPRVFGSIANDSSRGQVLMFGGNNNGVVLNDTWVWDGTNWTQKSPAAVPGARQAAAMTYDSDHAQAVMFGGALYRFNGITITVSELADTWTWDGSNWTQQSPPTSPAARDTAGIAYDSGRHVAVLFGGANNAALNTLVVGDTWTWSGGTLTPSGPTITGVQSASDFGAFSAAAPGSWIEIYGTNLAPDTRSWTDADFSGNSAPTSLDGVSVTAGGQPAFVDYISPSQINVQLPSNLPAGAAVPLAVKNGNGTSPSVNLTINATEPGLLAPASLTVAGKRYVVALLPDGVTYVLPPGAIPGVPSRPAKPGETITLYGIGFGTVTPAVPAGQVAAGQTKLSLPLQVLFGQTSATIEYQGLSPGSVGLYQFNVVVPSIPDGDAVPLTFTLGGAASTQTLYTAVSH